MNKIYAGIGSRETPLAMMEILKSLGYILGNKGYTLRSGGADGADTAFEDGARYAESKMEIWLPWQGFNGRDRTNLLPSDDHYAMGAVIHPCWFMLKNSVRSLHARNTAQVLGADLETPVDFVLCWTRDGCESHETTTAKTGGSATVIRLASIKGIPIFNLRNKESIHCFKSFLMKTEKADDTEHTGQTHT